MVYICILDFEATCWEDESHKDVMEIIEFPSILYTLEKSVLTYIAEFHQYVRPTMNPQLTDFCIQLTGIQQVTVDQAETFAHVYRNHYAWLMEKTQGQKCIFLTCGHWDLKTQLPREFRNKGLGKCPNVYKHYINIKEDFTSFYRKKPSSMIQMLDHLGLKLEGHHHSGYDDCKNIAQILHRIVADGYTNFGLHTVV